MVGPKKTLKEAFLMPEEEGDSLGRDTMTDYHSLGEVQAAMRKKVYEALKTGDAQAVTDAVKEAVLQGAKFGYVTGWDEAWTEAEEGSDASYVG